MNQVIINAERRARQEFKKSPDFLAKSKSDVMHITTKKFELSGKVNQLQLYTQKLSFLSMKNYRIYQYT